MASVVRRTLRCTRAERAEIRERAAALGMSVSGYLVACALHEDAGGPRRDEPRLVLSEEQQLTLYQRVSLNTSSTSASVIAASDGPTRRFTTRMEGSAYSMTAVSPSRVIRTWSGEAGRGLFSRILPPPTPTGAAPVPRRVEFPDAFSALRVWLPCRTKRTCPTNSRGKPLLHYSHPRSRNASRTTPGGAYQPSAPYRAPMLNATSLFP